MFAKWCDNCGLSDCPECYPPYDNIPRSLADYTRVVTVTSKDIDNRMEDAAAFGLRWGAALAAKQAEVVKRILEHD